MILAMMKKLMKEMKLIVVVVVGLMVGGELMSGCVMQEGKVRERTGGGSALYLCLVPSRRGG